MTWNDEIASPYLLAWPDVVGRRADAERMQGVEKRGKTTNEGQSCSRPTHAVFKRVGSALVSGPVFPILPAFALLVRVVTALRHYAGRQAHLRPSGH